VTPRKVVSGRARSRAGATGHRVPAPRRRLFVVVTGIVLVGAVAAALVVWSAPRLGLTSSIFTLDWLGGPALVPALVTLTCAGELVAVRLRQSGAVEELTLFDAVVVVNALLLPPADAVLVSTAGLLLAYCLRRRAPVKSLFNLGMYAAAASLLAFAVRVVAGQPDGSAFDGRLVAAVSVGTLGFAVVNLVCMAVVLVTVNEAPLVEFLRREARLSALMVVGSVALASTAIVMALHAPALLPFAALPAAALTYAYRAAAQEADERERSSRLLTFSQLLAASPDRGVAIDAFLRLTRDVFAADEVLVIFTDGAVIGVDRDAETGPQPVPSTEAHRSLLQVPVRGAVMMKRELPAGWAKAALAPLEADGTRMGAVVLAARRRGNLGARDLTLLMPLASALAVALRNGEHLSQIVEQSGKLKAVVEGSSDGILVLSGNGLVQLWNPAVARLSGYAEPDALGKPLTALFDAHEPDGSPADAFDKARHLMSPESPHANVELEVMQPDGEMRSIRCSHSGIFDDHGNLVRDVVIVHDLTRERQVERLKADFIATVSHELRTPVTPIKGYADMLRKRGDSMTPEKRAQCLDLIADRAAHLARLVEDLLLASKMTREVEPAQQVVIGVADLAALTRRSLEDFDSARERLHLAVPALPLPVACDEIRTVQVLTNLISNALKYSLVESPVEVRVEARNRTGMVSVADSGRGLPADQLEKIFDKFHRVEDPMVMTTSGTGLGLYIARNLARAMNGDITVRSRLGVGSVFTVTLPLAVSKVQAANHAAASPSHDGVDALPHRQ